jgi:hypothetical protein
LQQSFTSLQSLKEEFEIVIKGKIELLQEKVKIIVNEEAGALQNIIYERLDKMQEDLLRKKVLISIQADMNHLILDKFHAIKNKLEEEIKVQFKNLIEEYRERSHSFLNYLSGQLMELLGIGFEVIADRFDLDVYTTFYLTVSSDIKMVSLGIFPTRQKLINKLKKHYHEVIIRNIASIGYDLQYKIQESFRKFNYNLNNRLSELYEELQIVITNTMLSKNKVGYALQDEIDEIKEKLSILDSINLQTDEN